MLFLYAYVTTELHLLTDRSKEYEQSWMFLDRRMEEILSMGSDIMFLR
jgi:ubiquinone biosynthesis protein COQ9